MPTAKKWKISLLRHGEPVGGVRYRGITDDPLSENGWQQMSTAVGVCPPASCIVTSPLKRCREFAEHLANRQGLPLIENQALAEMDFGDWEGHTAEFLYENYPKVFTSFLADPEHHTPPNAESLLNYAQKVIGAWSVLIEQYHGQPLLIITHGGTIRVLFHYILGIPLSRINTIEIPYACISSFELTAYPDNGTFARLVSHGNHPRA